MSDPVSIVTHCDKFHCDEVTACAMLKYLYGSVDIIRTRDTEKITQLIAHGAIVVDVGKVLNPENLQFDHHQSKCVDTYNDYWTIPLSSCGLVYKHYADDIINKKATELKGKVKLTDKQRSSIRNRLYSTFVVSIDANDTGVPYIKRDLKIDLNSICNYRSHITLCDVIARMNHKDVFDHKVQYSRFMDAVDVAENVFILYLTNVIQDELEFTKELTEFELIFNSERDNPEILIINKNFRVRRLLPKLDPEQLVKYIIAPRGHKGWQIWTVNKPGKRFETLAPIASEVTAREVLGEQSDDLVFVHANHFIAGFKTQEAAIRVATYSLLQYSMLEKWRQSLAADTIATVRGMLTTENLVKGTVLAGAIAIGAILGTRLSIK